MRPTVMVAMVILLILAVGGVVVLFQFGKDEPTASDEPPRPSYKFEYRLDRGPVAERLCRCEATIRDNITGDALATIILLSEWGGTDTSRWSSLDGQLQAVVTLEVTADGLRASYTSEISHRGRPLEFNTATVDLQPSD